MSVRVADVEEQKHGTIQNEKRQMRNDFLEFCILNSSLLQRHISADDAFQVPVFGAHQQRAVVIE
jgi:hypothetical protein